MLNSSGLSTMFPHVMERLELPTTVPKGGADNLPAFNEYLSHMAYLQQVPAPRASEAPRTCDMRGRALVRAATCCCKTSCCSRSVGFYVLPT